MIMFFHYTLCYFFEVALHPLCRIEKQLTFFNLKQFKRLVKDGEILLKDGKILLKAGKILLKLSLYLTNIVF